MAQVESGEEATGFSLWETLDFQGQLWFVSHLQTPNSETEFRLTFNLSAVVIGSLVL